MFSKIEKRRKYVILFVAVLIIIGLTQIIQADEWTCEDAFELCVLEHFHDPGGMIRCMLGYAFCKEFLEN